MQEKFIWGVSMKSISIALFQITSLYTSSVFLVHFHVLLEILPIKDTRLVNIISENDNNSRGIKKKNQAV